MRTLNCLLCLGLFFNQPTFAKTGNPPDDPSLRALIRKTAPFLVEERQRRDTIRVNKDGTFSREDGSKFNTEGHWKISEGKLKLTWSTGDSYTYKVGQRGHAPLIAGQKINKNSRYVVKQND